jgi:hypothetical protein
MFDVAPIAPPRMCRHCGKVRISRPRALCWICYYTVGVRDLHPPIAPTGRRGLALDTIKGKRPTRPTSALPGTPEKIEVMRARCERGEELFHPRDAQLEPLVVAELASAWAI